MNPSVMIFFASVVYSLENGYTIPLSEYGSIVSIVKDRSYLCSGILIDEKHILTVAHIIAMHSSADLTAIIGDTSFFISHSTHYFVEEVYFHPALKIRNTGIDDTCYDNDIALLRLRAELALNPPLAPASLENTEYSDNDNCSFCVLISWQLPKKQKNAVILAFEFIHLMDNEVNQQWAEDLGEHEELFTDDHQKTAISEVDLGSPIVCGNFTRGIVVREKQNVFQGRPAVMIRIAPHLGFIQEIVYNGLFDVEPHKYPYIISIWIGKTYVCGGFILDATHIATAGHCVANEEAFNYTVAVTSDAAPIQWLSIAHITLYPGFNVESPFPPVNEYIDHDFAILTLAGIISWIGSTRPLTLPELGDFHGGQICELLRWMPDNGGIELMSSRVVLVEEWSQQLLDPSIKSQVLSFWGRTPYVMPIADSKDAGNPIICDDKPVGFLAQAISTYGDPPPRVARFLKIRPYMEYSPNMLNQNK